MATVKSKKKLKFRASALRQNDSLYSLVIKKIIPDTSCIINVSFTNLCEESIKRRWQTSIVKVIHKDCDIKKEKVRQFNNIKALKIGLDCSRNLEKVNTRIALFWETNKGWVAEEEVLLQEIKP